MKNTKRYILDQLEKKQINQQEAVVMLKELQEKETVDNQEIAIIGVSCRVPMAENKDEFWDNIINGRNCFTPEPIEKLKVDKIYSNPYYAEYLGIEPFGKENENVDNYVGAFIKDFDKFDAAFFGIPPREASYIDPQQRIFLEAAWTAIEDAGYSVDTITGTKTGVFLGCDGTNSINYKNITEYDSMIVSGTWKGILASRINYIYDLKGPALLLDTACSSGLVAVHEACKSLRNKECTMALAGGIAISAGGVEQETSEELVNTDDSGAISMVTSKDNKIRAFDKKCSGTVFGEGVVVFLLKPLKEAERDHDHIYGVIKGSAINSDGASNGLTAPNPAAQEAVIVDAWKKSKVDPETISYIETHGTGTLLGDPIEVLGLTNAFSRFTDKKQFCGIGSVKSNIGHIVAASGCANILKVVLSMNNQVLPPSIYFDEPNEHINFIDSPVYVVDKPTQWSSKNEKLRAGVSAFGFSGTNCHLILEEYKAMKKSSNEKQLYLFVLSAKTKTAICNIIQRYVEYFKAGYQERIEDICYVASTGRGHYTYRVALIVRSLDELKEKINYLYSHGLETHEEQSIFCGESFVISDKRQAQTEGEIRESELRDISKKATLIVEQKEFSKETLTSLASLYVKGANIDWNCYYENEDVRKVPLPTYQFDRTTYWGVEKVSKVAGNIASDSIQQFNHALVKKCLVESMHESIYQVTFNLNKHWVLQEHRIMGSNIVSGTTYIEIIIEALRHFYNNDRIVLKSVLFFEPLVVTEDDEDVETQIIIKKGEKEDEFLVVSKHYDTQEQVVWLEHVRGTSGIHDEEMVPKQSLQEIVNNPNIGNIIFKLPESNAGFGPRWLSVENIYRLNSEAGEDLYSEVCLDNKYLDDMKEYRFHPALLDDAINMAVFQYYTGAELYLPFTYQNMKVFRDIPRHFYSKIHKLDRGNNSEIISFNVELLDLEGNVIAIVDECAVKKVNKFNNYVANNFYGVKWNSVPEVNHEQKIPKGNVLIFANKSDLPEKIGDKINNETNKVYYIFNGDAYKKLDETHYEVGNDQDSYEQLIKGLNIDKVSTVYHLSTVDFERKEYAIDEYSGVLDVGLNSLFYLAQTFMKHMKGNTDFVLVSDCAHEVTGEEEYIKPANTSFLALAKTLRDECPGYFFRCIDVDSETSQEKLIECILANRAESRIALRKNQVYTECLHMVDIDRKVDNEVMIKPDGVYLITGGTGGLGLEVANNFSDFESCNICLVARREIPSRDQWDEIIGKQEDKKLCNIIEKVRTIESKGSTVIFKYADVSNYDEIKKVVNELQAEFSDINGIVHCAGVAGDGIIYNKTTEKFMNVIKPKVYGTLNLDILTREHNLDFFVLYSSMQTLFGGTGQGDYTAANAFLDSYPAYLKKMGRKCIAINWPGWSETGMAVDYNVADTVTLFKSILSQVGINAFNNMVRYNVSNLIPGDMNFEVLTNIGIENLPIKLSDQLLRSWRRFQERKNSSSDVGKREIIKREDLIVLGKSEEDYTQTEKDVSYIYAAVLNITEIDIYENFSSMGGDSIIATEVIKVLNNQYNNILNVSDIFTYSTVEEMATYIDEKLGNTATVLIEDTVQEEDDVLTLFESGKIGVEAMLNILDEDGKE